MSALETNACFRVTGGSPLSGEITPQGNKNEVLPSQAVACLTREPVTLENLPAITDVEVMQQILRSLGVCVERDHDHCTVQAASDPGGDLPVAPCAQLGITGS